MAETLTLEAELEQAKELAERYQFEFIDLRDFRPDLELLRSIPLEYMVRYEFLPLEAPNHSLVIAVADPTDLARLDELEAKLDRRLVVKVAAPSQVGDFLKNTDPSERILDKESLSEKFRSLRLDVLGHSERELKRLRRFIREPYGMVLVTGPTGSGKTTTLYAALSEIKSEEDKIITIEDPVEYQIRGITQISVKERKG